MMLAVYLLAAGAVLLGVILAVALSLAAARGDRQLERELAARRGVTVDLDQRRRG